MTDNSEKLKDIAGNMVDYYIDSIADKLYDDLFETGDYKETDDEFIKDFQLVYLHLTLMLSNDACDSLMRTLDKKQKL